MLKVEKSPVPGTKYGGLFTLPLTIINDSKANTLAIWISFSETLIVYIDCELCDYAFVFILTLS